MVTQVYSFHNSDSCKGIGLLSSGDFSHDVIEIAGSYPAEGSWARNLEAEEQVIVVRGRGTLILRDSNVVHLDAHDDAKRAVAVPARQWFRWGGDMTISMVCVPSFDSRKYEVKTDEAIGDSE